MKWISYTAAAAILCLMLTGCGGSAKPQGGTVTPVKQEANPTIAEPAATEPVAETEATVSLGRMEGGTYENAYAGYGCKLDENWEYYTAEELQDLSDLNQEMLQDSKLAEEAGKYQQITDMMAENAQTLQSINVLYTQLSLQERLAYSTMSEEEIIDLTLGQKDTLIETYAQMGIEATSMEKVKVTFLGKEHYAMRTSATVQGANYYTLQLFNFNLGGKYYVTLTLASFVEDSTSELLGLFYPVQ